MASHLNPFEISTLKKIALFRQIQKTCRKVACNPIKVIVRPKSHSIDHSHNVRSHLLKIACRQFLKSNTKLGESVVNFSFHLWPNVSFISHPYNNILLVVGFSCTYFFLLSLSYCNTIAKS